MEEINNNENEENASKPSSSNNVIQVRKKSATSELADNGPITIKKITRAKQKCWR